jgi:1-deoxy-D-xylulose-5-phosphate reductoisomerase
MSAGHNLQELEIQIAQHRPSMVSVAERSSAERLAVLYPDIKVLCGSEGIGEVACHPEAHMVVAALVGAVGLTPTVAAIRAGKDIALANKETLVVAGDLVMREAADAGVHVLPIDSEHSAIHQALRAGPQETVKRLILTASGGPFRGWSEEQMSTATVADVLAHPTWEMGPKITVDSATMMNKGLEIIEAHHLFGVPEGKVDVLVHPQSLVHSMVEYLDGTLIAQMSVNDMRLPIQNALTWPDRIPSPLPSLDLVDAGPLSFEAPDAHRWPALDLAREALRSGGEMPAVLNAANEIAVESFLEGKCFFGDIADTVRAVVKQWSSRNCPLDSIDQAIAADREARRLAVAWLRKYRPVTMGSQ